MFWNGGGEEHDWNSLLTCEISLSLVWNSPPPRMYIIISIRLGLRQLGSYESDKKYTYVEYEFSKGSQEVR